MFHSRLHREFLKVFLKTVPTTFNKQNLAVNWLGLLLSRIKNVWMRTVCNERPVFILDADAKVELIKQFVFLDGETVNDSNKTKSNNQQKHL